MHACMYVCMYIHIYIYMCNSPNGDGSKPIWVNSHPLTNHFRVYT